MGSKWGKLDSYKETKGHMKKLLTALGVAALLAAGCASHSQDNNGMGGTRETSEQSFKTDSVNKTSSGQDKTSSDQLNNNATQGSDTAPNSATGNPQ